MTSISVSKYSFPSQYDDQVIYKGQRYRVFLISKTKPYLDYFDGFIVWDGLFDAALAKGELSEDGLYTGELAFSHVTVEIPPTTSIKDFVANAKREQERFFEDSGS